MTDQDSPPQTRTLLIPSRFNGPPGSGNGGYAAGALAAHLAPPEGGAVQVSLRQPPPLDATMQVTGSDSELSLTFGGALIATAGLVSLDPRPVEPVSPGEAAEASQRYAGFDFHPFPTCFACGTERSDGLAIYPGLTGDGVRVAAPWTPDPSLTDGDHERASLPATWAALDCVGGWAGDLTERLMVLGRMTAVIDDLPVIGEPHVVVGEAIGHDGRKTMTAATLHDSDGRIVARAEHVWIAVDPAVFGGLRP